MEGRRQNIKIENLNQWIDVLNMTVGGKDGQKQSLFQTWCYSGYPSYISIDFRGTDVPIFNVDKKGPAQSESESYSPNKNKTIPRNMDLDGKKSRFRNLFL